MDMRIFVKCIVIADSLQAHKFALVRIQEMAMYAIAAAIF